MNYSQFVGVARPCLRRGVLAAFVFGLALACSQTIAQAPLPQAKAPDPGPVMNLTAAQWRADLAWMADEMERRHKNLFHTVSREKFAAAVKELDARIPALKRNEIIVGLMRIAALVHDGHTRIEPLKDKKFGFPSLPLKLYWFEDGVYIRAAQPAHADLLGARIETIGGVPIEDAIARVSEISPQENASTPKLYVPVYLGMPDILHALGLSPDSHAAVFRLRKGKRTWTQTIAAAAIEPMWPPDTDISLVTPEGWIDSRAADAALPLWLQAPLDLHRLQELPAQQALYAQLNMVTDTDKQSLADFGRRIHERARALNPRAVILDLRLNRGGNGNLANAFVRELIRTEDADTQLFVLSWRGTFSASQFILDDLDRLSNAVFIGEPASSKPTSYGDAYRSILPNSGITVRDSIVYWQQGQNMSPWTWIDVATPLSFADYAAGRDRALEAALAYQPHPPLEEQFIAATRARGLKGLRQEVDAYLDAPKSRFANHEQQLTRTAEALSNAGLNEAALAIAELAVQRFPSSIDAANITAHVAESMGRRELALQSGLRTLALDPNNRWARSLVERMRLPAQ